MTKKERMEMERLKMLFEAERERAEKAWASYRETLYELVEVKAKLNAIKELLGDDLGA